MRPWERRPSSRSLLALTALLVLVSAGALQAQEPQAARFRIQSIDYRIDGRTSPYALARALDLEVGKTFPDEPSLMRFLDAKSQELWNLRVLESTALHWSFGAPESEGFIPVDLSVEVKDTWNLVALPYGKYDSNEGLTLSIRGRDYNFLGSMEPLKLDLDYRYDQNGRSAFALGLESTIPFAFLGSDWTWENVGTISFPADDPGKPRLDETSTLSMALPYVGPFRPELAFEQNVYANVRDDDYVITDPFYLREDLSLSYPVYLQGDKNGPSVTPALGYALAWTPSGTVSEDYRENNFYVSQELTGGRADWVGNLRRGFTYELKEALYFHPDSMEWSNSVDTENAFFAARPPFGFAARLSGFWDWNDYRKEIAEPLRGILDKRLDGWAALFINLDAPFSLVHFEPSRWFDKPNLHVFDFEGQVSPFFDFGAVAPMTGTFGAENLWYSGGLELLGYPAVARSFYVRISLGYDLQAVAATGSLSAPSPRDGADTKELYVGMGLHY